MRYKCRLCGERRVNGRRRRRVCSRCKQGMTRHKVNCPVCGIRRILPDSLMCIKCFKKSDKKSDPGATKECTNCLTIQSKTGLPWKMCCECLRVQYSQNLPTGRIVPPRARKKKQIAEDDDVRFEDARKMIEENRHSPFTFDGTDTYNEM